MKADNFLEKVLIWLQQTAQGTLGQELESRSLENLRITQARKGFIRCDYIVSSRASDIDGNWHVGAIATLMDVIGAVAVYSVAHRIITSVDFNISYYSTAKIEEEVEVDAKIMGNKGRLTQVMIEVKRKENGELIALGKQWMASNNLTVVPQPNDDNEVTDSSKNKINTETEQTAVYTNYISSDLL